MWDPSWISHSTLTKHQAGTSVQDWWPVWPVRYSADLLKRGQMLSCLPVATWTSLKQSTFGLQCTERISYSI